MRQAIETLMDKLTDKKVTFDVGDTLIDWRGEKNGLVFLRYHGEDLLFYDKQKDCNQLYTKLMLTSLKGLTLKPKPVYLHDVLDRITKSNLQIEDTEQRMIRLLRLWYLVGLTKSLNTIFEEAEWEYVDTLPPTRQCSLLPKQPEILELFQFLLFLHL